MKDIHKLRKKVQEKSIELETLKGLYVKSQVKVSYLEDELIKAGEKLTLKKVIFDPILNDILSKMPLMKETEHSLFCDEHKKEVVELATTFSGFTTGQPLFLHDKQCYFAEAGGTSGNCWISYNSDLSNKINLDKKTASLLKSEKEVVEPSTTSEKPIVDAPTNFLANVKFRIQKQHKDKLSLTEAQHSMNFLSTNNYGKISSGCYDGDVFDEWLEKEVSIYEAKPELIPEGMRYVKELDKLGIILYPIEDDVGSEEFTSRFKPSVKFIIPDIITLPRDLKFLSNYYGASTSPKGKMIFNSYEDDNVYKSSSCQEVSIYEAIPELVPNGFYFNTEHKTLLSLNETVIKVDTEANETFMAKMALLDNKPLYSIKVDKLELPNELLDLLHAFDFPKGTVLDDKFGLEFLKADKFSSDIKLNFKVFYNPKKS